MYGQTRHSYRAMMPFFLFSQPHLGCVRGTCKVARTALREQAVQIVQSRSDDPFSRWVLNMDVVFLVSDYLFLFHVCIHMCFLLGWHCWYIWCNRDTWYIYIYGFGMSYSTSKSPIYVKAMYILLELKCHIQSENKRDIGASSPSERTPCATKSWSVSRSANVCTTSTLSTLARHTGNEDIGSKRKQCWSGIFVRGIHIGHDKCPLCWSIHTLRVYWNDQEGKKG